MMTSVRSAQRPDRRHSRRGRAAARGSVAINFANIIGRYFFSVSIQWAEEIMLFLMIGCVFLGSGAVGWSRRQIRMDAFVALLPPRCAQFLEVVCRAR